MRRAGATGKILIRADSAFYSNKVIAYLEAKDCLYSIAIRLHKPIAERIAQIPEAAGARTRLSREESASWPRPPTAAGD